MINLLLQLGASAGKIVNAAGQSVFESVFSVSKLISKIAEKLESQWKAVLKILYQNAGEDDEKYDGEVSLIEYSNYGMDSQQAQMMVERWITNCWSNNGSSMGLRELSNAANELGLSDVQTVINQITGNRKPIFKDSIYKAIEAAALKDAKTT